MKKIFGISLAAILAPMMAHAAAVPGDPGATAEGTAAHLAEITGPEPKYQLKDAKPATDGNVANARYVKGAYNALIRAINAEKDEIDNMGDGLATKAGVVNTLKTATVIGGSASASAGSVTLSSTALSSGSITASGNVKFDVTVMNNWDDDSAASSALSTTGSFSKTLQYNTLTAAAPTANTIAVSGGTATLAIDTTSVSYHN